MSRTPITFEAAPEFERRHPSEWEPLVERLKGDETLFVPNRSTSSVSAGLRPFALRAGRIVRTRTGLRAGVEGVFVWFEARP